MNYGYNVTSNDVLSKYVTRHHRKSDREHTIIEEYQIAIMRDWSLTSSMESWSILYFTLFSHYL